MFLKHFIGQMEKLPRLCPNKKVGKQFIIYFISNNEINKLGIFKFKLENITQLFNKSSTSFFIQIALSIHHPLFPFLNLLIIRC